MKKVFIFVMIFIIFCGCENKKIIVVDEKNNDKPKKEIIKYVDNNPVKLGFYDNTRKLINSIESNWTRKKDISWPSVFPIIEETLSKEHYKTLWQRYWNEYLNKNYKFGYEINYSLISGDNINLTILKPSDNEVGFEYVELYIYDGLNETASWFDHLDDDEITDKTVITSIKITSGINIDEVVSPIVLKVFTYDGLDDFDESGKYIGNSVTTVTINKSN